jgi:hypothetical protein
VGKDEGGVAKQAQFGAEVVKYQVIMCARAHCDEGEISGFLAQRSLAN